MNNKEIKKKIKEQQRWENSIEGIRYNLSVVGNAMVKGEEDSILICKTLKKIPKKAREKVLDEVVFVVMGEIYGTLLRYNIYDLEARARVVDNNKGVAFILFNFDLMRREKEKETAMMDTIAHEIAHYILGHAEIRSKDLSEKREKDADNLAVKWGFKKSYRDYKIFE